MLGFAGNISLLHNSQTYSKKGADGFLLIHTQSPWNFYLLHLSINFALMDLLRCRFITKMDFIWPLYAVQLLLPVLWTLHLLRYDQLPSRCHRQLEIRVLQFEVRITTEEHSLPGIRRKFLLLYSRESNGLLSTGSVHIITISCPITRNSWWWSLYLFFTQRETRKSECWWRSNFWK